MSKSVRRAVAVAVLVTIAVLATMSLAPAQEKKDKGEKGKAPALIFEVYKDKGGEFRFRIKDDTGVTLGGSSKGYEKKEEVMMIVDAIKKGAATAKIDDQSGKK